MTIVLHCYIYFFIVKRREYDEHYNNSSATCFNSMRRVLEHYFQLLGGKNYEKCIDEFEGEDKIVCNALISVINDGSHYVNDDFVIQFDSDSIQRYKEVFKQVFEKLGQLDHYEMMMSR
ncbi:AAA family ATPase [Enterococcus sp. DIV0876]|uniref:AAA family ATPase n=1 Tax=Enterococcus sp. DIV0876 TaxID=2774633 RepID=UPI003D2FA0EB